MEVYDKIADLALLWRRAGEIFPRFADVACNWEEAFYQFLPRLLQADDRQTHLLFAEFLNLLGDGHTDYQFPRAFLQKIGFAPFSLGFCADAYFLNGVSQEYGAFLGAAVETLDGRPFQEILNALQIQIYIFVSVQTDFTETMSDHNLSDLFCTKPRAVEGIVNQSVSHDIVFQER